MKRLITLCAVVVMLLGTYARADMFNFDDITTTGGWADVPSNYMGFTWAGDWEVMTQTFHNSTYGGTLTFPSSPNAAYNGDNTTNLLTTTTETPITLDSLYASMFGPSATGRSTIVTVTGYLDASLVGSDTFNLSVGFTQYFPTFGLVDMVQFTGSSVTNYAYLVDDISITPVPVPGAVLLGILGLSAVGIKLRKYA